MKIRFFNQNGLCFLKILLFGICICCSACGQIGGAKPVQMAKPFVDGNHVEVSVRNTGEAGFVKITVEKGNTHWSGREHFKSGEDRIVRIECQGIGQVNGTVAATVQRN